MSTLRFCARPSEVSLVAIGWYCAYPAAESRSGEMRYCTISNRTSSVERAVESSQFDAILSVWMGTVSVCPSIRNRQERTARMEAI